LLPALINTGLAANDRAKYYFTLLQTAAARADHPERANSDLRRERIACGVEDDAWDNVIAATEQRGNSTYHIPRAAQLRDMLLSDIGVMLAPLDVERGVGLRRRFEQLRGQIPLATDDILSATDIGAMTSGARDRGDSLHIVIMDAHKALNAMQAEIASESVDGASTYGLAASDFARVRAFMSGLHRTAPLKFEHPGLGTTATRVGDRLVLQNDIGTTDAHVLVVHVEELRVTLTYTDVHLQRLLFFQNLFERWDVDWEDTRSRRDDALEDGVYHLSVGAFTGADERELLDYLAFLGSRLVFLIDWNKARKRLRELVSKADTIRLLAWAAEHDYGHMAFLKAGGEQLIYDALNYVVKGQVRFGERLEAILGSKEAVDYLRFVIKACAESLGKGEPESFIQDAVRAELINYFRTGQQLVYDVAAEHAALIVEIAAGIRDSLLEMRAADGGAGLRRNAERAKEWERLADALVNRARADAKHAGSSAEFLSIVESADDIADEFEEAAFHLTLIPAGAHGATPRVDLQVLGELLVQAAQEYVKVIETARHVRRGGAREDMQDFLEATHRVMALEHQADEAHRSVQAALAAGVGDFRLLHVLTEAAKNLEQAADALMHTSLRMRDYVIGHVMAA
jgi:uncharacterized protein Yka (UPF0111/DUF47 family)